VILSEKKLRRFEREKGMNLMEKMEVDGTGCDGVKS
jgi:hypothetical protein